MRDRKTSCLKVDIGKILGKLPWMSKIPLQGNGMAAIPKRWEQACGFKRKREREKRKREKYKKIKSQKQTDKGKQIDWERERESQILVQTIYKDRYGNSCGSENGGPALWFENDDQLLKNQSKVLQSYCILGNRGIVGGYFYSPKGMKDCERTHLHVLLGFLLAQSLCKPTHQLGSLK